MPEPKHKWSWDLNRFACERLHGHLKDWLSSRSSCYLNVNEPMKLSDFPLGWWNCIKESARHDAQVYEWVKAHILDPFESLKQKESAEDTPDRVNDIITSLKCLSHNLTHNLPAEKLTWVEPRTGYLKEGSGESAVQAEKGPPAPSRGEPLPLDTLLSLAELTGPDAMFNPIGRLLKALRNCPDEWRTTYELAGNKGGNAHISTKKRLNLLKDQFRLVEHSSAGWRLGESAYPSKGETQVKPFQ